MEVRIHNAPSVSWRCNSSWNPPSDFKIAGPIRPKTSLKPSTLPSFIKNSLRCSQNFHEEGKLDSCRTLSIIPENFNFPVVVCPSGTVSRYFWDGREFKWVTVDGINQFFLRDFFLDYEDGMKKLGRVCGSAMRNFFLPREVNENYLEYVKWKFLHRVFSSTLQVLATQAMFRAIGLGYSRSLPSAAALNWVLKDGVGRLSRCIYTATLASAFDTNLKRIRFSASVLFSLSIGVELLTPLFPNYFLLLATTANVAKQISLACYLATGSAVHRSFAVADNLGEVSAKSQIQMTLTKNRLELIINMWSQLGYVPSPAQVSKMEGVGFLKSQGMEFLPIRIGCVIPKRKILKLSMVTMRYLSDEDLYFICMESLGRRFELKDFGIVLCIREGAGTSDVIMGLVQACYIQKSIQHELLSLVKCFEACDISDQVLGEWCILIENSKRSAASSYGQLMEDMSKLGWACKNILLSSQEQARYRFVAE